ncbi:helix-turn-helix transcriptional regulator [Bifidobacterium moukalabense]|uniref:helix-turn-helix transcriptional regulator n=2 Tax=Bifidobacterium moukalabense TaxID=1333651 RepID=UPI0010F66E55|nr:helix-turn-helix transcriptional regulator [Bifidobacterium moukalabense]
MAGKASTIATMVASDRDAKIGENLLHLRGAMSQDALAEKMRSRGHKWSKATVWSVEKGERPLKLSEAMDLCSILSTGPHDLDALTLETLDADLQNAVTTLRERVQSFDAQWASVEVKRQELLSLLITLFDSDEKKYPLDRDISSALTWLYMTRPEVLLRNNIFSWGGRTALGGAATTPTYKDSVDYYYSSHSKDIESALRKLQDDIRDGQDLTSSVTEYVINVIASGSVESSNALQDRLDHAVYLDNDLYSFLATLKEEMKRTCASGE